MGVARALACGEGVTKGVGVGALEESGLWDTCEESVG